MKSLARLRRNQRGMVLIFSLWVLMIIVILAVGVAGGIRQKITMIKHLDHRQRKTHAVMSMTRYAIAVIQRSFESSKGLYSGALKEALHRNTTELNNVVLGDDSVNLQYRDVETGQILFGVVDEERKININTANFSMLTALSEKVLRMPTDAAKELAAAMIDWRTKGNEELKGFYSQEYYQQLKNPYPKHDAPYQTIEELLLVKGMTKERFEALRPYVTVYGDGLVNINTASSVVLQCLGMSDELIDKLRHVRAGADGVEQTGDDYVFLKMFDVAIELKTMTTLNPKLIKEMDDLISKEVFSSGSSVFSMEVSVFFKDGGSSPSVKVVYDMRKNQIIYWNEK